MPVVAVAAVAEVEVSQGKGLIPAVAPASAVSVLAVAPMVAFAPDAAAAAEWKAILFYALCYQWQVKPFPGVLRVARRRRSFADGWLIHYWDPGFSVKA